MKTINKLYFLALLLCITQLNAQTITNFMLVDATTGEYLKKLSNYSILNLSQPTDINIVANTTGDVGSIIFYTGHTQFSIENTAPYALAGDNAGDFNTWNPTDTSSLILRAELYSAEGGNGTLLSTRSITLNIVNDPNTIYPLSLAFNNCPTTSLEVGETIDLDVTLFPANTTRDNVGFSSSNGSSIDPIEGVFTATAPGEYIVRATNYIDTNVYDTCTIIVNEPPSLAFNNCPTTPIKVGDVIDFDVTFFGNVENTYIAFYANDGNGEKYLDEGVFTATTPGEYVITARNFGEAGEDTCTFTVIEAPSLAFTNCPTTSIEIGDVVDLNVDFFGDVTNTNVAFYSNDGSSVEYLDGVFTANASGEYVITARSFGEAGEDTCTITVNEAPSLAINNCPTTPLEVGETVDFDVTFLGNVTNTNVAFTSSDGGISLNYITGEFTAITPGEYTVYATSFGEAGFDSCTFTVAERSIALNNCPTAPLEVGETLDLDVTFFGDFTNTNLAFYSSDGGISINYITGEFSADTPGEYVVSVVSFEDGSLSDTCTITVVEPTTTSITGFTLVDADTGDYFNEIEESSFINPFQPTNLNIIANTTGNVGSVVFYINGDKFSTESVAPYSLAGDNAGNFNTWDTSSFIDSDSSITITGELYAEAGGNGTLLSTKSVTLGITTNRPDYIFPLGMTFDCPTTPIEVGETINVGIILLPANATGNHIKFPTVTGASVSSSATDSFTFSAQEPGVYEVSGTSYANGTLHETCTITVVDSSSNKSANLSKQVYDSLGIKTFPNPVINSLNIQFELDSEYKVRLFDLSGAKLIETTGTDSFSTLDVSTVKTGIYILETEQNGQVTRKKILKK